MSFSNNGHLAPRFSCARLQSSQTRGADIKRSLRSSVAALGLLALVASGAASPALAQGSPQAERKPDNLAPVLVPPPQRKPLRTCCRPPSCAGRGRSGHYRRAERTANTAQYQCRNRGRVPARPHRAAAPCDGGSDRQAGHRRSRPQDDHRYRQGRGRSDGRRCAGRARDLLYARLCRRPRDWRSPIGPRARIGRAPHR